MDVDKNKSALKHQEEDESYENVAKDKSEEKDVKGERYYEQLSFIDKPDDNKCGQSDKALYRIKCLIYVLFAMLGVVYIAGIVVIIATTLPKENYVSFAAMMTGCSSRYIEVSNERVVFNEILNNNMKGYNNETGLFTAPLSGVYLFIFFIEIEGAYGKVKLRVNDQLISYAVAYGMFQKITAIGQNHTLIFEATKTDDAKNDIYKNSRCIGGSFSIIGFGDKVNIKPNIDDCPYEDGVVSTGGNTAVTHVNAGDKVWIQTPENVTLLMRPKGTSLTGILLSRDE